VPELNDPVLVSREYSSLEELWAAVDVRFPG
jgi:hypothetical protein